MKKLLLLVSIMIFSVGTAQKDMAAVDAMIEDFTTKLQVRNITNYFVSKRYCDGEIQMSVMPDGSNCFSKGTFVEGYVVWSEDGEVRIKKMDNCGYFASVSLTDDTVYKYFIRHSASLQKDKIKPYEIAKKQGGPILSTEINNCHRRYMFVKDGVKGTQSFKPFDLTNDAKEKNINFDTNNKLPMATLDKAMTKAITEMESSSAYMRLK